MCNSGTNSLHCFRITFYNDIYVSLSEILNSDVTKVEAFGTIDNWCFI